MANKGASFCFSNSLNKAKEHQQQKKEKEKNGNSFTCIYRVLKLFTRIIMLYLLVKKKIVFKTQLDTSAKKHESLRQMF